MSKKPQLDSQLKLPCGAVLKNRLAKAAMTERLATKGIANDHLANLYRLWAANGAGLLISGNLMVDHRYKEAGGNIVLEDETGLEQLQKVTTAGTSYGTHFWAQISHPGRQATIFSTFKPIAPSPIQLHKMMLFAKPRDMTVADIKEVEHRFIRCGELCKLAGYSGIQLHAAHGYLLSQFLAPKTNLRSDKYGGSIENRARLLLDLVDGLREKLGSSYPISVKLNSADFQRGGMSVEDFLYVLEALKSAGVDLLEISGGTYEGTDFLTDRYKKDSTRKREAYFMDFASQVRAHSKMPLMVTGGFRSYSFCQQALADDELDVVGMARPFLQQIDFPKGFIEGSIDRIPDADFKVSIKMLADFAEAGFYDFQIHQLAKGKSLKPQYNPYSAVVRLVKNEISKGWFKG